MSVGRRIGGSLVAAVLTLFALQVAPSLAFGSPSSGEITRAQASPDWTVAASPGAQTPRFRAVNAWNQQKNQNRQKKKAPGKNQTSDGKNYSGRKRATGPRTQPS